MRKMRNKLRGREGESLVEMLCAILIFALASVAMYTMVVTGSTINAAAGEADRDFREALRIVEMAEGEGEEGTITMTFTDGRGQEQRFALEVEVYRAGELYSYFRAQEGDGK